MYFKELGHGLGVMLTSDDPVVVDEDWSGATVEIFGASGTRFEDCIFDRLRTKRFGAGSYSAVTEFVNCSFEGANIVFGSCRRARFVECSFRGARLKDLNSQRLDIVGCDFSGAVLRQCVFWGRPTQWEVDRDPFLPGVNEVVGNDFSTARLIGTDFRYGVDLTRQKLPVGKEYAYSPDAVAALGRVRRVVEGWRDTQPADYDVFRSWLKIWEEGPTYGQEQLFISQDKPRMSDGAWGQIRDAVINGE